MGTEYHCGGCDTRVVLVEGGGVHRDIICKYCGHEMDVVDSVSTEYVGYGTEQECEFCDHHIAENVDD